METASHGGLHFHGKAITAVPAQVRATFIEGPTWAEEDLELPIALTFLHCRDHIDSDKLWLPAEKLHEAALKSATSYERYKATADLLTHQIARAKASLPVTAIMKMTKHREFMVSEDGVHLMHGEFTLCGDAFDIGDTEDEPDAPTMKATRHRTVTCAKCIDIILLCRNVRIRERDE